MKYFLTLLIFLLLFYPHENAAKATLQTDEFADAVLMRMLRNFPQKALSKFKQASKSSRPQTRDIYAEHLDKALLRVLEVVPIEERDQFKVMSDYFKEISQTQYLRSYNAQISYQLSQKSRLIYECSPTVKIHFLESSRLIEREDKTALKNSMFYLELSEFFGFHKASYSLNEQFYKECLSVLMLAERPSNIDELFPTPTPKIDYLSPCIEQYYFQIKKYLSLRDCFELSRVSKIFNALFRDEEALKFWSHKYFILALQKPELANGWYFFGVDQRRGKECYMMAAATLGSPKAISILADIYQNRDVQEERYKKRDIVSVMISLAYKQNENAILILMAWARNQKTVRDICQLEEFIEVFKYLARKGDERALRILEDFYVNYTEKYFGLPEIIRFHYDEAMKFFLEQAVKGQIYALKCLIQWHLKGEEVWHDLLKTLDTTEFKYFLNELALKGNKVAEAALKLF